MVGAGMEVSIGVFLHQHTSRSHDGGVCHDEERLGSVQHLDYWGGQECFFELDKGIILVLSLVKSYPLFGQVMEWLSERREVWDELSVAVTESDEGPNCFD